MALKTYLQMCKDFVNEVGILGGSFTSVVDQTGEALNVARWIAEADYYVQGLYFDWPWLWSQASGTLTQNSDALPRASNLNILKKTPMIIGKGTDSFHQVTYMEYVPFFELFETGVKQTNDEPAYFTQTPDYTASLLLSEKIKSTGKTYYYEHWKRPVLMTANADTSAMQPYDEETGSIISARAKLWYASREDAPEVEGDAAAEYEDKLARLTAVALPGRDGAYKGSNQDNFLEVTTSHDGYGQNYGRIR